MNYVTRYFWAGILLASLIASPAQAGGLYLYELGTPDVGTAAAGWAARAQDAGTVFTNPAGMTLSLIHISEPTRPILVSRMPSSA